MFDPPCSICCVPHNLDCCVRQNPSQGCVARGVVEYPTTTLVQYEGSLFGFPPIDLILARPVFV